MIVAFTGHRPNKLGGYKPNPLQADIRCAITDKLRELKAEYVISGMALGVDQWAALAAIELGIPFIAAVPFAGQETAWPPQSQKEYHELIAKADRKIIVCDGGYAPIKLQRRNEFMVDNCDALIAIWDGTTGGTANCVSYAHKNKCVILRLDPDNLEWSTVDLEQSLFLLRRGSGYRRI